MKKSNKNNKGFSLVELIVVVLIMAIIAVALTPQVIKWVQTSRESKAVNEAGAVLTAVNSALMVDLNGGKSKTSQNYDFTFNKNGLTTSGTDTDKKAFLDLVCDELGIAKTNASGIANGYVCSSEDIDFTIKVTNGVVSCKETGMDYYDTLQPDGITES